MMEKIQNSPIQMLNPAAPKAPVAEANSASVGATESSDAAAVADFSVQLSKAASETQVSSEESGENTGPVVVKKGKKEESKVSADASALAASGGMLSQPGQIPLAPVKLESPQMTAGSSNQLEKRIQSSSKDVKSGKHALQDSAERSPETFKAAASVNTAQSIAGLKPWSKNWVFEGGEENPGLEPLFGSQVSAESGTPELTQVTRGMSEPQGKKPVGATVRNTESPRPTEKAQAKSAPNATAAKGAAAGPETAPGAMIDASLLSALAGLNGDIEEINAPQARWAPTSSYGKRQVAGKPQAASAPIGQSSEEFVSLRGGESTSNLGAGSPVVAGRARSPGSHGIDSPESKAAFEEMEFWRDGANQLSREIGSPRPVEAGQSLSAFGVAPLVMDQQPRQNPMALNPNAPVMNMTGQVTQGSMARNRLSTETLVGMSGGIRSLSSQGGGSMNIRLKPDNLGELEVRVFTRGNQVGLKIQASDMKAKKVIEDSMGYLKDNMAAQNLSLAKIEVGVLAPNHAQGQSQFSDSNANQNAYSNPSQPDGFRDFRDQSGFNSQSQQWSANQNDGGERRGSRVVDSDEVSSGNVRSLARAGAMGGAQRFAASGSGGSGQRLNLLA